MIILTPNRRLTTFLQREHNLQQQALGKVVWEEPKIYPINVWLEQLWQQTVHAWSYKILTALEQQLIWEEIINSSDIGQQLLNVKITAEQVLKAWESLQQWEISLTEVQDYVDPSVDNLNSDTAAFLTWAQSYQQWCQRNGYLDFYAMVGLLLTEINALAALPNALPEACGFYAFQELAPQQQKLIALLRQAGVKVRELQPEHGMCDLQQTIAIGADDAKHEYALAAHWAQQQLQNGERYIGIVIPNLDECRKDVERIFDEIFMEPKYNISAPRPMATYAMIDTAVLILQLALSNTVDLDLFSQLLRSEFVADSTGLCERAALDVALRELQEGKFSWQFLDTQLIILTGKYNCCAAFMQYYRQWRALMPKLQVPQQSTQAWLAVILELLTSLNWPGNNSNTVVAQHLLSRWRMLLGEYLHLDVILGEHDFSKAWQIISKLTARTPFLPETKEMPIQVLGVLEAAGMQFDKVWLLGMQRDVWPPEPKPNPFIPFAIQRKYDLPRSSPQRELKVAKNLSKVLLGGGKQQVVVSYPQMVENAETGISPLLRDIPRVAAEELVGDVAVAVRHGIGAQLDMQPDVQPGMQSGMQYTQQWEHIADELAPRYHLPITSAVPNTVPGGSKVLKLQSNCPFWAFAEIRLGAKAIKQKSIGLTASDRGILLHEVLAKFWLQVGSQEELYKLSSAAVQVILAAIIQECLAKFKRKRPYILTPDYLMLESQRLQQLLLVWLDLEGKREPFIVYKVEQASIVPLGELNFKVRLDRVDQLISGEVVIIDYKTSRPQANDWFGIRPADPQLPLYCIATKLLAHEIAFAVIRPEHIALQEYSNITNAQKADSWDAQLQVWQQNLTRLALEFAAGYAAVDPLKGAVTCAYCELQTFCRI